KVKKLQNNLDDKNNCIIELESKLKVKETNFNDMMASYEKQLSLANIKHNEELMKSN
ncbi:MAG: hypothetical protein MHPSP_001365, partial [Paramarteilia canceri]